jgi:AraC family transcriptional regulator of arabinose operon
MRLPSDFDSTPWLESPLKTRAGTIFLAGSLRNSPGIGSGRMRILGNYALVVLLKGTGVYRDARGREIPIQSGHAIHVFPELAHAYGPSTPGAEWNEIYVIFEGPIFSTLRDCALLSAEQPLSRLQDTSQTFERLKGIFAQPQPGAERHAARAVGEFLALLFDISAYPDATPTAAEDEAMRTAMGLLATPQEERWLSANEVASRVGMAYETFRKRFRRAVGLPPARYQMQKKIERACASLYPGPSSQKRLAADLGFFDEFHFSKAFRQVMGQPPSAYRRHLAGR